MKKPYVLEGRECILTYLTHELVECDEKPDLIEVQFTDGTDEQWLLLYDGDDGYPNGRYLPQEEPQPDEEPAE
jgi:hypothetical protein